MTVTTDKNTDPDDVLDDAAEGTENDAADEVSDAADEATDGAADQDTDTTAEADSSGETAERWCRVGRGAPGCCSDFSH